MCVCSCVCVSARAQAQASCASCSPAAWAKMLRFRQVHKHTFRISVCMCVHVCTLTGISRFPLVGRLLGVQPSDNVEDPEGAHADAARDKEGGASSSSSGGGPQVRAGMRGRLAAEKKGHGSQPACVSPLRCAPACEPVKPVSLSSP